MDSLGGPPRNDRPETDAAASTSNTDISADIGDISDDIEMDPVKRFDYMKMKFVGHRNAR